MLCIRFNFSFTRFHEIADHEMYDEDEASKLMTFGNSKLYKRNG